MKYFFSILILLIFSCFFFSAAKAEEEGWGNIMNSYKDTDFKKVITNTEYKKALETREKFAKKPKKDKFKEGTSTGAPQSESPAFEPADSPSPLLMIPVDTYYENQVIQQGFYLISVKREGAKYFIELRQGNSLPCASIEAKSFTVPGKNFLKPQSSVQNIDDKMIKINYNTADLVLESVLWKY